MVSKARQCSRMLVTLPVRCSQWILRGILLWGWLYVGFARCVPGDEISWWSLGYSSLKRSFCGVGPAGNRWKVIPGSRCRMIRNLVVRPISCVRVRRVSIILQVCELVRVESLFLTSCSPVLYRKQLQCPHPHVITIHELSCSPIPCPFVRCCRHAGAVSVPASLSIFWAFQWRLRRPFRLDFGLTKRIDFKPSSNRSTR